MRKVLLLVLVAMVSMTLAPLATAQDIGDIRIGVVIHNDPSRPFWTVVHNGARDAAERFGVHLTFVGSLDPLEQAQFVEDFVAAGVDGIAVSLANPDAMKGAIALALEAGIPVVSLNSGNNHFIEAGALMHFGQSEVVAGEGAGIRLNGMGVMGKVLCVNHQAANIALDERCRGLENTYAGEVERLDVTATAADDPVGTQNTIQTKLLTDDIHGVLTLNPVIAMIALRAIQEEESDATLATFDLTPDVLEAVQAGEIAFAIDQQQYLQGYLPVVFLVLNVWNANVAGGGLPILTGPGFVDASNAAAVVEYSARGTR